MFVNDKVCMIVALQVLSDGCKFVEHEFVRRPSGVVLCIEPIWPEHTYKLGFWPSEISHFGMG